MNQHDRPAVRAAAVRDARLGLLRWAAAIGLFASVLLAAAMALAQDGPQGVAFAQAEEGTWMCRDGDPETGLGCALELCATEAGGQECVPTTWCFPAGYAGTLTIMLPDFHTTRPICGAPSFEALVGAMQAFCDNAPDVTACYVGQAWAPDGEAIADAERELVPGEVMVPAK